MAAACPGIYAPRLVRETWVMANLSAIRSVGASLTTYLTRAYQTARFPDGITKPACTFTLATIGGLRAQDITVSETASQVVLLLYRVSTNPHLRNVGRVTDPDMQPSPLSVDLHYLLSFWAQSAENEQLVLAWTLRHLHVTPVLDGSVLSREAAWEANEIVQLIPEEISNEDLMRIWDTLEPDFRLSIPYIARVVRIDPDEPREHRRVVATRFDYHVPGNPP